MYTSITLWSSNSILRHRNSDLVLLVCCEAQRYAAQWGVGLGFWVGGFGDPKVLYISTLPHKWEGCLVCAGLSTSGKTSRMYQVGLLSNNVTITLNNE